MTLKILKLPQQKQQQQQATKKLNLKAEKIIKKSYFPYLRI